MTIWYRGGQALSCGRAASLDAAWSRHLPVRLCVAEMQRTLTSVPSMLPEELRPLRYLLAAAVHFRQLVAAAVRCH